MEQPYIHQGLNMKREEDNKNDSLCEIYSKPKGGRGIKNNLKL